MRFLEDFVTLSVYDVCVSVLCVRDIYVSVMSVCNV